MQTEHKTWTSHCVTKMWVMQGKNNNNLTDFVYIENVDEGVLTLSAFSVKVSLKRSFSRDFICQLLLSSRPLMAKL